MFTSLSIINEKQEKLVGEGPESSRGAQLHNRMIHCEWVKLSCRGPTCLSFMYSSKPLCRTLSSTVAPYALWNPLLDHNQEHCSGKKTNKQTGIQKYSLNISDMYSLRNHEKREVAILNEI